MNFFDGVEGFGIQELLERVGSGNEMEFMEVRRRLRVCDYKNDAAYEACLCLDRSTATSLLLSNLGGCIKTFHGNRGHTTCKLSSTVALLVELPQLQLLCFCTSIKPVCRAVQDIQQSPQMIDAIQMMLSDPSSYAPLVEHPELAPYMRALRRCTRTTKSCCAKPQTCYLQRRECCASTGSL